MAGGAGGRSSATVSSSRVHHDPILSTVAETKFVAISALRYGDSPRSIEEDKDHIKRLVEAAGNFPPILVHRSSMRVIDGRHRLKAALLRGETEIEVAFFDGKPDDVFIRAVAENITHGLPLTLEDRKAAALRIIASHPHLSDRVIASYTGLAHKTIARLRERSSGDAPQSNARIGADKRMRPLDGSEGRLRASQVIADRPDASLREVARSAGVSLGTVYDVHRRIRRGEHPVTESQQSDWKPERSRSTYEKRTAPRPDNSLSAATLDRLRKDPAVRFNEAGRELLRWLSVHAVGLGRWSELAASLPPHCTVTLTQLAHYYAEEWRAMERELIRIQADRQDRPISRLQSVHAYRACSSPTNPATPRVRY